MRQAWWWTAAAVCGLGLAYGIGVSKAQPAVRAPAPIGVVDIVHIFNEYDQTKWLNQQFDGIRNAIKAEADSRTADIEKTQETLKVYHPDTPEYRRTSWELIRKRGELEGFLNAAEFQVSQEHKDWTLKTYQEIERAIARAAEKHGMDAVLTYEQLQEDAPDSAALRQQIRFRHVMYHSSRIDLTAEVLGELNAEFAKRPPPKLGEIGVGAP